MLTDLSIIIATYNEDPRNLSLMVSTLASVLEPTALCYEIIFVNDGSRATTTQALRALALEQTQVKVIELSRNFGQQAAITCGLDYSQGRAVVNLDSDLQDPPELIPEMIKKWQEGFDVVYAQRYTRKDSVFKRITAFLFYRLLGAVSTVKIPVDSGDFRLMDRKVVKALASLPEKTRFIRGMVPWLGFKQIGIPIDRRAREVGESTYTFKKMVSLAVDGLLAFSSAPLFLISAVGIFLVLISGLALLLTLTVCAANHIMLVLEFLGFFTGLQITCMGIIALYLARVLDEARARPIYLVSEIIEKKCSEEKML